MADEEKAIAALAEAVQVDDMAGVILFCSSTYDRDKLQKAINQYFSCPVIGCTTAGEVNPEYQENSISALALSGKAFKLHSVLLDLENGLDRAFLKSLLKINSTPAELGDGTVGENSVGFLLIDGLSMKEELIAAYIHDALPHLPIIGGSAGDDLQFRETCVFAEGGFHSNAAVFTFIETSLDFETFKLQHFEPSDKELVVTDADPANRIVYEIDGEPAAECYARTLGLPVDDLNPKVFSMNPLMLQIGEDWYVRSIQKANVDGSLLFYCAIDTGLPLTIGRGMDIERSLENAIARIAGGFSHIDLSLGCDCVLRRLEILERQKQREAGDILAAINFFGFSTFGEQFNSLHINQTLTGVTFGAKHEQ